MPVPVMRRVFSSHVDAIGFDADTGELHVTFQASKSKPARTAVYHGVSAKAAQAVIDAPSIGLALHQNIRGQFPFTYRQVHP
jgi:hypothetical protein